MNLSLSAALLGLFTLAAIYRLLLQAARGERWVTLSRTLSIPPEEALRRLHNAWDNTCLTFSRVEKIEVYPDGSRSPFPALENGFQPIRVRRLDGLPSGTLGMSTIASDSRGLCEIWSVEGHGEASRVTVQVRTTTVWLAVPRLILAARRKLHQFTSGAVDYSEPPQKGVSAAEIPASAPRKTRRVSGFNPANYSHEILISLFAFAILIVQFDVASAIQLTLVILLHEYGHLLAYQLTGKKGNRLMLVPFMGGIAVSESQHKSEFERAVCALAGPAICVPLSIAGFAYAYYAEEYTVAVDWAWGITYFSCLLNALNLLPIFPLDGGQVAEAYLRSFVRGSLMPLMLILSLLGLMVLVYLDYKQMALFVAVLGLPRLLRRTETPSMRAMSTRESLVIFAGFTLAAATHGGIYYLWWIS